MTAHDMNNSHLMPVPIRERLGIRLALWLVLAGAIFLLGLAWFGVSMYTDERKAALRRHADDAAAIATVMEQVDASGKRGAQLLYQQFEQVFTPAGLEWSEIDGAGVLHHFGTPVKDNFTLVDLFSERTGGVATVFQRDGDDFLRITTSVKKEDGSRAVGTKLGKDHPAYAMVMRGEAYVGKATLFGRTYMTKYQPISLAGEVRAVLFIGYELATEMALLDKMLATQQRDTRVTAVLDISRGPTQGRWRGVDWPALAADDALLNRWRDAVLSGRNNGLWEGIDRIGPMQGDVNVSWHAYPA